MYRGRPFEFISVSAGTPDYSVFLQETCKLRDIPFMLEHLQTQDDYRLAADYIRSVGKNSGVLFL